MLEEFYTSKLHNILLLSSFSEQSCLQVVINCSSTSIPRFILDLIDCIFFSLSCVFEEMQTFILQLDEELEGMQSTIMKLQDQLRQTKQQLAAAQTRVEQGLLNAGSENSDAAAAAGVGEVCAGTVTENPHCADVLADDPTQFSSDASVDPHAVGDKAGQEESMAVSGCASGETASACADTFTAGSKCAGNGSACCGRTEVPNGVHGTETSALAQLASASSDHGHAGVAYDQTSAHSQTKQLRVETRESTATHAHSFDAARSE